LKLPAKKDVKKYFTQMIKTSDRNVYAISVIIALAVVTSLLVYSYIALRKDYGFTNFYVLDADKKAENYPEVLILGKNNTCRLWVVIENHMGKTASYRVLLKIINSPISSLPISTSANESYDVIIATEKHWEKLINITMEKTGNFHLIFELWLYDNENGRFEFTNLFVDLPIEVREG